VTIFAPCFQERCLGEWSQLGSNFGRSGDELQFQESFDAGERTRTHSGSFRFCSAAESHESRRIGKLTDIAIGFLNGRRKRAEQCTNMAAKLVAAFKGWTKSADLPLTQSLN